MSKNSNIDRYGGKSIIPIRCRYEHGTGFYIGNNYFLTAYHVVSDANYDNSAVIATINHKEYPCTFIKLGEMDVALLKCEDIIDETTVEPIKLLNTQFFEGLELQIIGYPQEIGNGVDYFNVNVKNVRDLLNEDKQGFDTLVQRIDPFGFYSYSGFSGSPVLNEFGYAIGVVTDQIHNTLGYTSIKSVAEELIKHKIVIHTNADELDTRPYGIGYCIKMATKSVDKVRARYNEACHVEDEYFENYIKFFCGIDKDIDQKKLWDDYNKWFSSLPSKNQLFCKKYAHFMHYLSTKEMDNNFFYDIESIAVASETGKDGLFGNYLVAFQKLMDRISDVQDIESIYNERFLFITGDAGCGKTQQLCHIVTKICKKSNVYLFFGTDFYSAEDPTITIAKILNWSKDKYLEELNDEMIKRNSYATFILDALNEGEGTFFWIDRLPHLKCAIEKYEHLKLIVSVRTIENSDKLKFVLQNGGWKRLTFSGFQSEKICKEALSKYFKYNNIGEDPSSYLRYDIFKLPLFVKIFCEVYHSLPFEMRQDVDLLFLYRLYIHKKNDEVSRLADEDPELDVTSKLLYGLGEYSLILFSCCDIPRNEAIKLSNNICKNRLWSKNLYHSAVRSNLLMEYKTKYEGMTTFEFDNMGDYIRSTIIMDETSDEKRFNLILNLAAEYEKTSSSKIKHTIIAFFSIWNPEKEYWKRIVQSSNEFLKTALLESLSNRNINSEKSTLSEEFVKEIIASNNNILNISYVLQHLKLLQGNLVSLLHKTLMAMTMVERDEKWTIGVNMLLDNYRFTSLINNIKIYDEEDVLTFLHILCWMMCSSHPRIRNIIIRIVKQHLCDYTQLCINLIELFHNVNDPYIQYGLYGAIYGVLLTKYDTQLTHNIAQKIYEFHYQHQVNVPSDISVRVWTLKIIEFNHYLNTSDEYWDNSQPPYTPNDNLMAYLNEDNFSSNNYFGESDGAHELYRSLFVWDFNRYVIGTNSRTKSAIFIQNGDGVSLEKITKAIANRIKHIYKYSELLSKYDAHIKWEQKIERTTERIGKKYQWIALREIYAYLCDTCEINKDWTGLELAEKPYPWYADSHSYFDPTLNLNNNHLVLDNNLFDNLSDEELFGLSSEEWIESRDAMPHINIIIKDKKGIEWVFLVGYQTYNAESEGEQRETFLFYNTCLVKKQDNNVEKFSDWAKSQNFCGRWMPERTGNYEFLWNEYPWSDTSKQFGETDEIEIWNNNAPCNIVLPYCAQLQEDYSGVEDEKCIDSTVYMPLRKMYELFGLRNAERGVIRNQDGEIVAINRNIPGDALHGLVIKRDLLNQFLDNEHFELFYCNLGEKQIQTDNELKIQQLTGCLLYTKNNEPLEIQKMTDEKDLPSKSSSEKGNPNIGIDISEWLDMDENVNKIGELI